MTKVVLADDHVMFNECLQMALAGDEFEVVGIATDGLEAVKLAMDHRPQLMLLDVNMPKMHGLDVAREVHRALPSTRLVFLTCRADEACLREALQTGAKGYILKTESMSEIESALKKICAGGLYVSSNFLTTMIFQWVQNQPSEQRTEVLSLRESQVLKLIAEGHSTKQIAGLLSISPKTADSHRTRLMAKLGIHEIAGLVRYALQKGIVSDG